MLDEQSRLGELRQLCISRLGLCVEATTRRDPRAQCALRGHSEGFERALREHSEGTQRALRGHSEGTQRALRGHSEAITHNPSVAVGMRSMLPQRVTMAAMVVEKSATHKKEATSVIG